MSRIKVKVTIFAYHYIDTSDYPDEDAEVEEGEEQPDLSEDGAINAFAEELSEDDEALTTYIEGALERGDFDSVDVTRA